MNPVKCINVRPPGNGQTSRHMFHAIGKSTIYVALNPYQFTDALSASAAEELWTYCGKRAIPHGDKFLLLT